MLCYSFYCYTILFVVQQFDEKTILSATDNFSSDAKLGEGGFGEVYKGLLHGSFVAVKRLSIVSILYGSFIGVYEIHG